MKGENISEGDQEVIKKFEIAVQLVKSLPQSASFSPSYAEATKIYSYFKQSKFGPCSIPRPGFWDVVNRAKWDAWSALGNMPPETAMKNYVEEIKKVYNRIKDIDAFEEKHVDFADVLIPFCQATGTPMTTKLMEIVKNRSTKAIQINGSNGMNGNTESDDNSNNGDIVTSNGVDNDSSPSCNGEDILDTEVLKVSKSVKFQISEENGSQSYKHGIEESPADDEFICNIPDNHSDSLLKDKAEKITEYEKEEGELSSSENDSEDEEIYCDSLDPDQIIDASNQNKTGEHSSESAPDLTDENVPSVTVEPISAVSTEPLLFSPIPAATTTFQDTTAQNILLKSADHSHSSSNSRSDFELVDAPRDEKKSFQSVRKRDRSPLSNPSSCNELSKTLDKRLNRKATFANDNPETCGVSEQVCLACVRTHKKPGHHSSIRQSHSGNRNDNKGQTSNRSSNNGSNGSNTNQNFHNHHHHHHRHDKNHNGRSASDGSNNGGSDDDSCSSISSSSSDNVGLKIVKALERMDDNMQLILNRLDSIDNSMKILAVQPPPPWWVQYVPSKWVILSTLWPFIVNLTFFYLWRRRRRRIRRKLQLKNIPTNWNQT